MARADVLLSQTHVLLSQVDVLLSQADVPMARVDVSMAQVGVPMVWGLPPLPCHRTRQGRLWSNCQPGTRNCIAAASSRAPKPIVR